MIHYLILDKGQLFFLQNVIDQKELDGLRQDTISFILEINLSERTALLKLIILFRLVINLNIPTIKSILLNVILILIHN